MASISFPTRHGRHTEEVPSCGCENGLQKYVVQDIPNQEITLPQRSLVRILPWHFFEPHAAGEFQISGGARLSKK